MEGSSGFMGAGADTRLFWSLRLVVVFLYERNRGAVEGRLRSREEGELLSLLSLLGSF